MKLKNLLFGLGAASAATLVYGALYEANKLTIERANLRLKRWPERMAGFRIALMGDFHLRDQYTVDMGRKAVALALEEEPDMVLLLGDYVGYWQETSEDMLHEVFSPLLLMNGNVVGVPGNHDRWNAPEGALNRIFQELNIKLLRNEIWRHQGVAWVGIDSTNALKADPIKALRQLKDSDAPIILWHEPDCADVLPDMGALMVSGHSHGGQFTFPWGWTPMHTRNGSKYVRGFYPKAPTPLYVNRGLGTTGPPSRLNCSPEVTILTLDPA